MQSRVTCSRCSHVNESRARFCANCGLNLAAVRPPPLPQPRRSGDRAGTWVVLLLVGLAILLGGLAVAVRASRCRPPHVIYAPEFSPGRALQMEHRRNYLPREHRSYEIPRRIRHADD